jgi:hypothetical protein
LVFQILGVLVGETPRYPSISFQELTPYVDSAQRHFDIAKIVGSAPQSVDMHLEEYQKTRPKNLQPLQRMVSAVLPYKPW